MTAILYEKNPPLFKKLFVLYSNDYESTDDDDEDE
jgi:hypothetical protein